MIDLTEPRQRLVFWIIGTVDFAALIGLLLAGRPLYAAFPESFFVTFAVAPIVLLPLLAWWAYQRKRGGPNH